MNSTQTENKPQKKMTTEITFVYIVRYTKTVTKKDFLDEDHAWENGTEMTQDEKKTLWKKLVKESIGGEIEMDEGYEEEDDSGSWTDDLYEDVVNEQIDEMTEEKKKKDEEESPGYAMLEQLAREMSAQDPSV